MNGSLVFEASVAEMARHDVCVPPFRDNQGPIRPGGDDVRGVVMPGTVAKYLDHWGHLAPCAAAVWRKATGLSIIALFATIQ